jgi:hypothetical protein
MNSKLTFGEAIDSFLIYLAVERGLSENYQLLNRRLLGRLSAWLTVSGDKKSRWSQGFGALR